MLLHKSLLFSIHLVSCRSFSALFVKSGLSRSQGHYDRNCLRGVNTYKCSNCPGRSAAELYVPNPCVWDAAPRNIFLCHIDIMYRVRSVVVPFTSRVSTSIAIRGAGAQVTRSPRHAFIPLLSCVNNLPDDFSALTFVSIQPLKSAA